MAAELTHDATSRTITVDAGDLHYHEAGSGKPLILLHGSGPGVTAWANFRGNYGAFAERFRTLALDFPGFGVSYDPGGSPLMHAGASVLAFMDALGIDSAAVIGNSMGGAVAAQLAAAHPDRVTKLVTLGGVGAPIFSPSPAEGIKLLVQFAEDPTRPRLLAWMESMVYDPAILTEEFIELRWRTASDPQALAGIRRMYNAGTLELLRSMSVGDPANHSHLARIVAPTLVTWGRDDRVAPVDGALLPMRFIKRCELHVFPNCGHWAMIERKAEFESVVLAFLSRDEPAVT
jgi:2-hydroxy-6-oxonona-2,4-dienedioate hydrolase